MSFVVLVYQWGSIRKWMGFMMRNLRNSKGAMWKGNKETQEVVQWSRACGQRTATKPGEGREQL